MTTTFLDPQANLAPTSEHFKIFPDFRTHLFPESFLEAARLNPNYPYLLTSTSDDPNAEVKSVSYSHFLADVGRISNSLQMNIPKREVGAEPVYVGVFGRSSYSYAVHMFACIINYWTVSSYLR